MKRILTLVSILFLLIACFLFIPKTVTNYDMTVYLPNDSSTKKGIDILHDEFFEESSIQILIMDISLEALIPLMDLIHQVDYVKDIIWLDDYVDLSTVPIAFIPADLLLMFYQDGDALITIIFNTDPYNMTLESSISDIKDILSGYQIHLRSEILGHIEARHIASNEVIKIMTIIIPIIIFILLIASHAWIEPLLILLVLGVAVAFNTFTNGLLTHVSFITQTMALALQLALSIDYAIFMIHRYYEERKTHDAHDASRLARKYTFKSITASALTTIAGFTALFFMNYQIGMDIGLVLSKGIVFSYLTVMLLLPILLVWFDPLIEKTRHRMLMPSFKRFFKLQFKMRYAIFSLLLLLILGGLYFQSRVDYLYGSNALSGEKSTLALDENIITSRFGYNNQLVIIIPNETIEQEVRLSQALLAHPSITHVTALVTTVDPDIPRAFIPQEVLDQFIGTHHSRIIVNTSIYEENALLYQFAHELNEIVKTEYDTHYIVGNATALDDIRTSILDQKLIILVLTMLAVGIIVGIFFKSFIIPILLVGVIQGAVWLNVSILYFMHTEVIFIGYLVVMSIQLGATIDYAVLLTNRYIEERKMLPIKKAMEEAYSKSSVSILISGTILTIAGFAEGLFSNVSSVTDIGLLLGKGALLSTLIVFIFLPSALVMLDKLIIKKRESIA